AGDLMASWLAHDLLHVRQLVELRYGAMGGDLDGDGDDDGGSDGRSVDAAADDPHGSAENDHEPWDLRYAGEW
ncbi:MAG: hypothetical protein ABI780_07825, partial [Ardenticatenales bacterium]